MMPKSVSGFPPGIAFNRTSQSLYDANEHKAAASDRLGDPGPIHRVVPVPAAERDIFLVAADIDLRAFVQHLSLLVEPHHHRRLASAMADRAQLAHFVGDRQQLL